MAAKGSLIVHIFLEVYFHMKQMAVQTPAICISSNSKKQMFSNKVIVTLWLLLCIFLPFEM